MGVTFETPERGSDIREIFYFPPWLRLFGWGFIRSLKPNSPKRVDYLGGGGSLFEEVEQFLGGGFIFLYPA